MNDLSVEQSQAPHLTYAAASHRPQGPQGELREDLERLRMPDLWPHTLGTVWNDATQRKCLVSLPDDGLAEQTQDGLFALSGEH